MQRLQETHVKKKNPPLEMQLELKVTNIAGKNSIISLKL
jgi:hypothetical protein